MTPALDEAEIVNDELDPNHNKDLPVAVFDKKPSAAAMEQVSLAEMFKVRRRDVVEKL